MYHFLFICYYVGWKRRRLHSHRLLWIQWIYTCGKSKSTISFRVQNHHHWLTRSGKTGIVRIFPVYHDRFRNSILTGLEILYFQLSHINCTYALEKSRCMAIEVLSFSVSIKSRNNVDRWHQIFMNLHVHSVAIWTYSDASQYCFITQKYFEFDL